MHRIMSENTCDIISQDGSYQCSDQGVQVSQPESPHVSCRELKPLSRNNADDDLHHLSQDIKQDALGFILGKKCSHVLHTGKAVNEIFLKKVKVQWDSNDDRQKKDQLKNRRKNLEFFSQFCFAFTVHMSHISLSDI